MTSAKHSRRFDCGCGCFLRSSAHWLQSAAHVQVRVYDEATKTHTHTLWYCDPLPPELRATTSRLSAFVVLRLRWPGQEAGHRHLATNAQGCAAAAVAGASPSRGTPTVSSRLSSTPRTLTCCSAVAGTTLCRLAPPHAPFTCALARPSIPYPKRELLLGGLARSRGHGAGGEGGGHSSFRFASSARCSSVCLSRACECTRPPLGPRWPRRCS